AGCRRYEWNIGLSSATSRASCFRQGFSIRSPEKHRAHCRVQNRAQVITGSLGQGKHLANLPMAHGWHGRGMFSDSLFGWAPEGITAGRIMALAAMLMVGPQ